MKIIFTLLLFGFNLLKSHSATPTIASSSLTSNNIEGNSITFNWTTGNGTSRLVIVRKDIPVTAMPVNGVEYTANNIFGLGNEISTGQFVAYKSTGSSFALSGLIPNSTYHIAIFEFNGSGFSTEYLTAAFLSGNRSTLSAPSTQVNNLLASTVTGNSLQLNFTPGNGTSRLILAKANAPVDANPIDLINYSHNNQFGIGFEIGSGNYVVAKDGTQATITGLQPNTTYHFAAIEFNGAAGPVYLNVSPSLVSQLTAPRPTVASSGLSFSGIEGNSIQLAWTAGNGARRIVIVKAGSAVTAVPADGVNYTANNVFGSGQQIAPNEFIVYDGVNPSFTLTNLQHSTTYHVAIFEYDGSGTNTAYLSSSFLAANRSTLTIPTTPSSNLTVGTVTNNSITLNWINGNGAERLVIAKQGTAVNALPVNYATYFASGFGSGSQIGSGNFVVYRGSGNTTTITGLSFNTIYYFTVVEFNGNSGPVYLTTSPPVVNATTSNAPSIPSSNFYFNSIEGNSISFGWSAGSGSGRILIVKAGGPVTAVPVNGTSYSANNIFGSGFAIAPGEFVTSSGSSSSLNLTNLVPGITYHFAVFEYNGNGATTAYLTSPFLAGNRTTAAAPTTQTGSISFGATTGNSIQVTLTPGNGANRIVIARQGSPVNVSPVNFSVYFGSNTFGAGSQIGTGNYVVYIGSGNNFTVTSLQPNTTYHFASFEFNGALGPVYNTISPAINNIITLSRPTIASSNISFFNIEGNGMQFSWTAGNGTSRIVIARQGSPVTAVPVDGTSYTANSVFGLGSQISSGQYVVAVTNSNYTPVSNLSIGTQYYFAIYELDGTGSNTGYLTSSFLSANASTVTVPTIQTSSLQFTNITNSSVSVNWTNGNGANRLVVVRVGSPVNAVPVNLQAYFASANIQSASQITPGNYVVSNTSASSAPIYNLQPYTTYYFAVYEFNGSSGPVYLTSSPATGMFTTAGPPQVQANNAVANAINSAAATINWTNGDGHKRIVLMKANGPVDANPVNDVTYTANSFFGSGSQLGSGNYTIFNGTGNSVTVTNLNLNNTYHVAIFEYNEFGTSTKLYLTINPARATVTMSVPQTQATNAFAVPATISTASINWVNGNGHKRIVLMKVNAPVDADPVNGSSYTDNTVFGSGTQLGSGNYTVYNGTGNTVTVTNLVAGNIYHIAVFEYNDFGGINKLYLTINPARTNVSFGAPQVQAVNAVVNSVNSTTAIIGWTSGSGHKRIVLMKANAAVDADPVDGITYTANASFGAGTQIGSGNYTIFNGAGNNITVTNLSQANMYHIAVFEYNDFGAVNKYYLTISPARAIVPSSSLPVTFLEFNAKEINKKAVLQWSTAQEFNSARFEIERSNDGSLFEKTGSVIAAGNSAVRKDYFFTDNSVFSGRYYYRLKQVDLDGSFTYSGIVHITIKNNSLFRLLENPVRDMLTLSFNGNIQQPSTINIFDMGGRKVLEQTVDQTARTIDISRLNPGVYIIELLAANRMESLQFIKTK